MTARSARTAPGRRRAVHGGVRRRVRALRQQRGARGRVAVEQHDLHHRQRLAHAAADGVGRQGGAGHVDDVTVHADGVGQRLARVLRHEALAGHVRAVRLAVDHDGDAPAGAVRPHLDDVRDGPHLADLRHDGGVRDRRAVALGRVEVEAALVEARAEQALDRGRLVGRQQVPQLHHARRAREEQRQRLLLAEQHLRVVLGRGRRREQDQGERGAPEHPGPQK
jgi:hypothetical protein